MAGIEITGLAVSRINNKMQAEVGSNNLLKNDIVKY